MKMIKLKLKRRMSGKKIRQDLRSKELHPTKTETFTDDNGVIHTYTYPIHVRYENKGLYDRNRVQKRHVENPNIYKGEKPVPNPGIRNIRIPKKHRKNAWKRFKKAFPYAEVTKGGKLHYEPLRPIEEFPLKPTPKKVIN
jgi:hypothetical protein